MATTPAQTAAPTETPAAAPAETPAASAAAPAAPEAPKAPTPAEVRKMRLKMDGAEMELPEEEILRLASLGGSAQKRFQEAAMVRKQAEEAIEYVKNNPAEALKQLGLDPRKFAEEYLIDAIKREQESPEQKRIREAEEKIRTYEQKEKERETSEKKRKEAEESASKQKAEEELQAKWAKKYDDDITAALGKSGVPKNAYSVRRMATLLQINAKKNFNLDADSLAKLVSEDYEKEFGENYMTRFKNEKGYDGEALIKRLGPDAIKAILNARYAEIKKKPQEFAKAAAQAPEPTQPSGLSWREAQRRALRTGRK